MRKLQWGVLAVVMSLAACKESGQASSESSARKQSAVSGGPALVLTVAYGSEKKSWFEEQARAFEQSGAKTKSGRPIKVEGKAMGSGEAVQDIVSGKLKAHVYSPASSAYLPLLNSAWMASTGKTKPVVGEGEPLLLSPIVIAMWKPMAEALGWPGKPIGWADLMKVAADKRGWGAYGHPEWGRFKLGHTHPESSNSGLLSVLAEAYAGSGKTRGLTVADVEGPKTKALLSEIEGTVVHYGKSTGFFSDKMQQRGPGYLSAAVLYENLVIESYGKQTDAPFPLVSVYPVEGTFWSDHPYAVLDADWVGADEREAAQAFMTFLKARPAQERALALGFRPADPAVAIAAPVDAAHGADPKQPQTLLEVPGADVLEKLLAVWRETKKATDVTFVFDKSGSMVGRPLAEAKVGARRFLESLSDRDEVTLLFFDNNVYPPLGPRVLGEGRAELLGRVDGIIAEGGTALYSATLAAWQGARERARKEPGKIHAVVVMTDGKDESSTLTLADLQKSLTASTEESPVRIFTIAYGKGAEGQVLERIAEAAKGSSAKGSVEDIVQVYRDMASFF
ncbi:substrate-binding and VWA domain-containing protein [Vitiosangium sp. GDMCC 1.1324]|uniref:substrate-binding and vWA domain-containing protein n=1 Tax=Vitiosangium sp. (strain GDMCC 1.1324) TaxID=2138576 RepID=UPI000D3533E4|nr:substrate-binding and VWA domain-containing protein [Vitiosangium sp. GDMCC 1.1324]PTL81908.1 VWA domain-containing protein [Vitiosangium sp. GDMCC 1.1324]